MTTSVTAAKTGLCPGPWDFFRHENILKKPEKEKAEAKNSSFFSLLPEYSSNGCVPAEPFSAFPGTVKYPMQGKKSNANREKRLDFCCNVAYDSHNNEIAMSQK